MAQVLKAAELFRLFACSARGFPDRFTAAVEDRQQFSSGQVLTSFIDEIREKGVVSLTRRLANSFRMSV